MQTVSDHPDGYVRYRALVLLTGFNDPRAVASERHSYCSSCYTGRYPVEFPRDETSYLQLALKLDKDKEPVAN